MASRDNQEIVADDRVAVNFAQGASAIVVALDEQVALNEQVDRNQHRVVKLKRVDNPPLGLRLGRVISSEAPRTEEVERRLEEAGIVPSLRDSRLLRSGRAIQLRLVVELEDVSDKNESAEIEYVRDDANATWWLSTMAADVSGVQRDQSTREVLSSAHNNGKLWLKRQSDTEFRRTSDYEMVPEATEASLRVTSTPVPANASATSSDEARPRATLSQIKVGRGDELRYGPDPDLEPRYTETGKRKLISGSVDVPMEPPTLKLVLYSMSLHKGAISLVPEVTWLPFEEMLPESISDVSVPLDVIETLDINKARDQLEDLLTRMLPVFAADGSDDMALLAQAHHLSPVVLHYLNSLLRNIARTLYDGVRE